MIKHPNNGPTFSKSTINKPRGTAPSPERRQAALEQTMRDAEKEKRLRQRLKDDPVGLINETFGSIEEYLKKKYR
jgi:hypothetical protein